MKLDVVVLGSLGGKHMFWLKKDIYWQVVPVQQSTSSSQISPMQEGGEDGVAEAVVLLDEDEVVELDVVVLGF